jgi:hypothetical protein
MCRSVRCAVCGKTTWSGCGAHIAQVRAGVPAEQWCPGHSDSESGGAPRGPVDR